MIKRTITLSLGDDMIAILQKERERIFSLAGVKVSMSALVRALIIEAIKERKNK